MLSLALVGAPQPQYSFSGYLITVYSAYLPTQLPIFAALMLNHVCLILRRLPQVSIVWEERSNESHTEKSLENTLWRTQCNCSEIS